MRHLRAADYREMKWANGRGATREVLRLPAEGPILWRISLAEVPEDGPFSPFPGLARILTVIAGDGLLLSGPGIALEARPWRPVRFSGEVPIDARLIGDPVRDLNLIYDPTQLTAEVEVLAGPCQIEATAVWLAEGATGALRPGDAALLEEGEALTLEADCRAIAIRLKTR
jgi:environmental stress-induced protein Ves